MRRHLMVLGMAAVGLLSAVWMAKAFGQAAGAPGQRDPAQMRQAMMERIKASLGCTDDQWKALQPKVEKVQTLSSQARATGFGMGRRGPGGGTVAAAGARQLSEVEKMSQELRTVLDNKDAKPEEVKQKLTALREARAKAREELTKAQAALREGLTVSQEAQLVLMGLLD